MMMCRNRVIEVAQSHEHRKSLRSTENMSSIATRSCLRLINPASNTNALVRADQDGSGFVWYCLFMPRHTSTYTSFSSLTMLHTWDKKQMQSELKPVRRSADEQL